MRVCVSKKEERRGREMGGRPSIHLINQEKEKKEKDENIKTQRSSEKSEKRKDSVRG